MKSLIAISLFSFLVMMLSSCSNNASKKNRLSFASSPYLQQHADNPVNWYEWSDETIAVAKKENKPLLISIGYASCHWCHVMEKETFMDTAAARIMNENFICIKVDREERPDLDNIYMNACQLLTGNGGWPLNAFALPDGKPFFAGTYYTRQSWINLLKQITQAYKDKQDLVVKQAEALTNGMAEEELSFGKSDSAATVMKKNNYQSLFDSIYLELDYTNGGLKGSPKFPMPAVTEFLLQHYYFTGNEQALDAATNTLNRMALGGMYDQAGGGFARYSTDSLWHIPHFEKMLYDNALLVSLYSHAYQLTQNDFYKTILTETITFIERDLAAAEGGFYSSLNADTEEGEGKYYAWEYDEFKNHTGNEKLFTEYFNLTSAGNWEKGKNILYASQTPREFSLLKNQLPEQFISALQKTKTNLLAARNNRNKPAADTKILTSWNAMMLKSYADAYAATGIESYLNKATAIAEFLEKNMLAKNGSLKRNYNPGKKAVDGFLDDYAWTTLAFIKLYQCNFDKHWLTLAKQIAGYAIENFYNQPAGLFYYAASGEAKLAVLKMEVADNAIPSSNAVMASVLYPLGVLFGDSAYTAISSEMIKSATKRFYALPSYHAQWCTLAGLYAYGTYEIVLMGKDALAKNRELQKKYLPACIFMGETDEENLPLLENKLRNDKTLIYVCTNRFCKMPVEDVNGALAQIN